MVPATELGQVEAEARSEPDALYGCRETFIRPSRSIVRSYSKAIRAMYAGEKEEVQGLVAETREMVAEASAAGSTNMAASSRW